MVRKNLVVAAIIVVVLAAGVYAQTAIVPAKQVIPVVLTGPLNAITDVPGIEVGSYEHNFTGTTVILAPKGAVGGVDA